MRHHFYDSSDYKRKQSDRTTLNWSKGIYKRQVANEEQRKCKRRDCNIFFKVKPYSIRQFCSQKYTPDFYLPEQNIYVEIKNFLAPYSANRDKQFRELFPKEKLLLILKPDYLRLQEKFAQRIKNWEF